MQAYRTLEGRFARLGSIEDVIGILHWDARTMMPDGAAEDRSNQLAILNGPALGFLTAPEICDLLNEAEQSKDTLTPWQCANLREMRRAHLHAAALPGDLVEASTRAVSRAELVWHEARQNSDFAQLLPHLATVLAVQRQIGQAKGDALGLSPYDALLDRYDPGLRQPRSPLYLPTFERTCPTCLQAARTAQERRAAIQPSRARSPETPNSVSLSG
jgi:carboxypeptidase Taq